MAWQPFDLYAERYDQWFEDEPGRSIFPSELAAIELLLNGTGPRRLEVGVGTGRFAKSLGITLGLDPALGVLRMAQRRGVEVVQGVGEALPIASASFDVVLFVATLCFLDDARAALREAVRVLSPGGAVVVADVIADSAWGRFYLEQKDAGHPFYAAASFYELSELNRLLEEAELTVVRSVSTLAQEPVASSIVTEPPTCGINPSSSFVCLLGAPSS